MDPMSGRLYESVEAAREDGVKNPVELRGELEDVKRISEALKALQLKELAEEEGSK